MKARYKQLKKYKGVGDSYLQNSNEWYGPDSGFGSGTMSKSPLGLDSSYSPESIVGNYSTSDDYKQPSKFNLNQAGQIGGVIGSVVGIGNSIGEPIRARQENIDYNTGRYTGSENKRVALGAIGAVLNPMKAQEFSQEAKSLSTGDKIASVFSPGYGMKKLYNKREEENIKKANLRNLQQTNQTVYGNRIEDLAQDSAMTFEEGGFTDSTKVNTVYPLVKTYNNQELVPTTDTVSSRNPISGVITSNYTPITELTYYFENKGKNIPDSVSFKDFQKNKVNYLPKVDPQSGYRNELYRYEGNKYYKNFPQVNASAKDYQLLKDKNLIPKTGSQRIDDKLLDPNRHISKANGGKLNGTRYNKNLTYYKAGGETHETSPYGGIPIGNKGLVEDGEFRFKNYIFSDRF
jgi:hypothetical protein